MKAVNTIKDYFKTSLEELTKVTWPTKNQAVKLTIIVIIFCVITAGLLGVIDFGLNELHTYILNLNA